MIKIEILKFLGFGVMKGTKHFTILPCIMSLFIHTHDSMVWTLALHVKHM